MQREILNAELTRAKTKKDGERTAYDCVVLGFGDNPDAAGRLRDSSRPRRKKTLERQRLGSAYVVVADQRIWGWGLPPDEAGIEKRGHLADRQLQAAVHAVDLAPHDTLAQGMLAHGFYAKCHSDRFRIEAEKAVALNPYDADNLGWLGIVWRFPASGMKGRRSPKRRSS